MRITQNLYAAGYKDPAAVPVLIEQLRHNRYSQGRIAAANLLSLQQEKGNDICRELGEVRQQLQATAAPDLELAITLDRAMAALRCN